MLACDSGTGLGLGRGSLGRGGLGRGGIRSFGLAAGACRLLGFHEVLDALLELGNNLRLLNE